MPNLHCSLSSVEHKRRYLEECWELNNIKQHQATFHHRDKTIEGKKYLQVPQKKESHIVLNTKE